MSVPPDGFVPHGRSSPVTDAWEPIFARTEADRVRLGLFVRPEHGNSRGLLHGGVIAALVDNAMGLSLRDVLSKSSRAFTGLVTTSLTVDYFGKADQGHWLEFDTQFVHAGGSQGVTQALIFADGISIARASATFRILK